MAGSHLIPEQSSALPTPAIELALYRSRRGGRRRLAASSTGEEREEK